ncbi:MAG TPA: hypothetical protein VMZ00_11695 [Sporichthya sp.]|nr:hypothetical protein [Sporichthya sp.]
MSKSIRAAVIVAMASLITVPAVGVAAAADHGEIGVGVSRGPQPYGTLTICAGRDDAPASTIKLIRNGRVMKSFKLSGCTLLNKNDGLTNGRYKVRHTAPAGYRTTGWISGGTSGTGDQRVSSISRSSFRIEPRASMSTAGFLSANSANWVTFSRTAR